jgi:hypothetical protein
MVKEEPYHTKIDIGCVGILTYELLFATAPFSIQTSKDFLKIVDRDVEFPAKPVS